MARHLSRSRAAAAVGVAVDGIRLPGALEALVRYQLFFSSDRGKTLILLRLRGEDMDGRLQNIDSTGLAAKIFRDKDLETHIRRSDLRAAVVPGRFGLVRTVPLWTFYLLGQG
jgi:hypothetical protein